MGLRCILGHDFCEPQVTREREEDGSEVVITVQEVKTCDRCGERQIVSENKEITSIEQLADEADRATAAADADGVDDADDGFVTNAADEVESTANGDQPTPSTEPAASGGESPTDLDESTPISGASAADASSTSPPADAEDDGAIIIDDAEVDSSTPDADAETDADEAPESDFDSDDVESPATADDSAEDGPIDDAGGEDGDGAIIIDDEDGDAPDLGGAETTLEEGSDAIVSGDGASGGADANSADADAADSETDAGVDDGVILDEEATEHKGERTHGEWPDHEERDHDASEHTPWPDQEGADEGYDAELSEEEADVSFGGGLTPERTADADAAAVRDGVDASGDGTEFIEGTDAPARGEAGVDADATTSDEVAADATTSDEPTEAAAPGTDSDADAESVDASSNITRVESPSLSTSMEGSVSEFYCPECGMSRASGGSSMRAGDICPDCRRGYVSERER